MKILIYMGGGFDTYGPSRHLYDALIEDLLNFNHVVHLIESHSTGKDSDIPEKFLAYENFSYETVKLDVTEKRAFAKRYIAGVKYCFRSIPHLINKRKQYDVMMVQSCPWAPFAVTFSKWCVQVPTIWNIQDMFPGASIANGVMKKKWMQSFFYAFHKIAYKKADHISVISEDMKQKVIEQGVSENKITVIPDWYDDKQVREIPWEDNLYVKKQKMSKDIFYVQYAGTMGFNFDYRMIISVAERLKDEKDIVFQMIGFGSQKEDFERAVIEKKLDNITFLPLESQEMVPHVYSACSVCLIPLPRGVIGNSVPSKAGLLMACRRVIVNSVDEDSDYYKMFKRERIGFSASNQNPDEVAKVILFAKDNLDIRNTYADNAKRFSESFFARSVNTSLYEKMFQEISSNNKED